MTCTYDVIMICETCVEETRTLRRTVKKSDLPIMKSPKNYAYYSARACFVEVEEIFLFSLIKTTRRRRC